MDIEEFRDQHTHRINALANMISAVLCEAGAAMPDGMDDDDPGVTMDIMFNAIVFVILRPRERFSSGNLGNLLHGVRRENDRDDADARRGGVAPGFEAAVLPRPNIRPNHGHEQLMLALACVVLAAGIATAIELDRELGGRFRYGAVMLSSIWGSMFMAVVDDEQLAAGFVSYMLVMLTFMYLVGFVGVLANKARERWGAWPRCGDVMTQAGQAIMAFEKARAAGRGSLGALHDALVAVEAVDRTVGTERPW